MKNYIMVRQAQRFVISGLLVTGLHVLLAVTFIHIVSPSPVLANGISFAIATVFSYLINTLWSFSNALHRKNLVRFIFVSIIGCLLAMIVSGFAEFYGMRYWSGIVGVLLVVPPVTFLLHSFWTYGADKHPVGN